VETTSRNTEQETTLISTRGAFVPPKTTVTLRAWEVNGRVSKTNTCLRAVGQRSRRQRQWNFERKTATV